MAGKAMAPRPLPEHQEVTIVRPVERAGARTGRPAGRDPDRDRPDCAHPAQGNDPCEPGFVMSKYSSGPRLTGTRIEIPSVQRGRP